MNTECNDSDYDYVGFRKWMKLVDEILSKMTGMISTDLPDVDYYGMYDNGDSPEEVAEYAIQYAKEN